MIEGIQGNHIGIYVITRWSLSGHLWSDHVEIDQMLHITIDNCLS